jgi:hypothetical protein
LTHYRYFAIESETLASIIETFRFTCCKSTIEASLLALEALKAGR